MDRGTSPVVGVVLLAAITVILAGSVAATLGSVSTPDAPTFASIDGHTDADDDRIVLVHRSGDPLDVEELDLFISVEGEPLENQTDVPFSGTDGFDGAPSGPFNAASSDHVWRAGDRASLVIAAGTNDPTPDPGDRVTVTISHDGYRIATVEMTAR